MEKALFNELIQRYRWDEEAAAALKTMVRIATPSQPISTPGLFMAIDIQRRNRLNYRPSDLLQEIMHGRVVIPDELSEVFDTARAIAIDRIRMCFPIRPDRITVNDLWDALGFPQFKTEPIAIAA